MSTRVRRALIAVSDKTGLAELAAGLYAADVEIVSTGGTARAVETAGIPVTPVERLTGFGEAFDGRVKTLHPAVHAGLLAEQDNPEHREQLERLDIAGFDLLVVNLYPFAETVASGAGAQQCIERIDIGGPAMVRAAAKNHASVAVIVDPGDYGWALERVRAGGFTAAERRGLAAAAYAHTASYDVAVASWFASNYAPEAATASAPGGTGVAEGATGSNEAAASGAASGSDRAAGGPPAFLGGAWHRAAVLRYGENPHQPAALYTAGSGGLAQAEQLHGKEMSYNNYVDADAALRAAHDQPVPAVAIIKHANPCGIAVGTGIAEAHRRAHACDPVSAFGGVIAANGQIDRDAAEQVAEIFTEVVLAPGYTAAALEALRGKKNLRILRVGAPHREDYELRAISGGVLAQAPDTLAAPGDDPAHWTLAAGGAADEARLADLAFAWRAVRAVKSNAILLAAGGASVGIGMGQVNRVDSAQLAVSRAGDRAAGSVAASDAFFPFPDGLQVLLDAGVRAIVQPGGSVRDGEVLAAAEAAGATVYLTGSRHFAH